MKFRTLVAFLTPALFSADVSAQQLEFEVGLENVGPLTMERTHHVRLGALGRDIYFGGSVSVNVSSQISIQLLGVKTMPTYMYVWPCESVPCPEINRFHHRPTPGPAVSIWVSHIGPGVRFDQPILGPSMLSVAFGPELMVVHGSNYYNWGALPMAALAGWLEVKLQARVGQTLAIGPHLGVSYLPTFLQKPGYTTFQEWAGGKVGKTVLPGYGDRDIMVLRAGVKVTTGLRRRTEPRDRT